MKQRCIPETDKAGGNYANTRYNNDTVENQDAVEDALQKRRAETKKPCYAKARHG